MKHGKGKYVMKDSSTYDGFWYQNKIEGKGLYIWADGKKYDGEF